MSIFDIDYEKLRRQLLPKRLLRFRIVAFVRAMTAPAVWMYGEFQNFRAAVTYELTHNGQVCRLQAVLNDRFDNTLRRIYIDDGPRVRPLFIFRRAELKPKYIRRRSEAAPVYLRRRSEMTRGGTFIVWVPISVDFDLEEMKSLVQQYKLAGKPFWIKTF